MELGEKGNVTDLVEVMDKGILGASSASVEQGQLHLVVLEQSFPV